MAEFAVAIDTVLVEPVDDGLVDVLLEHMRDAGAAFSVASDRLGTTFTVAGSNVLDAATRGSERWRALLAELDVAAGIDVAVEVLTADEQDRRLAEPIG